MARRLVDLFLYNHVNQGSEFVQALDAAVGWRRSTRLQGGYWQGSLTLYGKVGDLVGPFYEWMGYEIVERANQVRTWEGMVYEMELAHGMARRRRTLDLMVNAAKTTYTTMDFVGENLIDNPGFESAGGGGADVFASWNEGSGVVDNVATFHGGAHSCELTSDGVVDDEGHMTNTYIRQNLNCTAGQQYRLKFWTRGDGSHTGWFAVRNPNAPTTWIIPPVPTLVPGTTWTERSYVFTGPSGGEALIFLYPPHSNGDLAYFDDVEVIEKTEVVYVTPWAVQQQSLDRYGRKEEILLLDNYPLATAEAYRDTYLAEHAWPWPRPVALGDTGGEASLEIRAAGYVHTANWLHVSEGDGEDHNLDHWIGAMVGADYGLNVAHGGAVATAGDCEFLKTGVLASNSLQVTERVEMGDRPWEIISELVSLGDSSGNLYRCHVGNQRRLFYERVDLEPRYYLRGGRLYDKLSASVAVSPWRIQPGVVRDMSYPVSRAEQGSPFADARDILVDEVEVYQDGTVALKAADFSESEILSAQFEYLLNQAES